jgi:hypothetical protein
MATVIIQTYNEWDNNNNYATVIIQTRMTTQYYAITHIQKYCCLVRLSVSSETGCGTSLHYGGSGHELLPR